MGLVTPICSYLKLLVQLLDFWFSLLELPAEFWVRLIWTFVYWSLLSSSHSPMTAAHSFSPTLWLVWWTLQMCFEVPLRPGQQFCPGCRARPADPCMSSAFGWAIHWVFAYLAQAACTSHSLIGGCQLRGRSSRWTYLILWTRRRAKSAAAKRSAQASLPSCWAWLRNGWIGHEQ